MAVQDSSPERRNLLVISLCLIVYFLGGGSFSKDEIRLQVISITFSRPDVLCVIIWLMFFWFLYRYWVVNYSAFGTEFNSEVNDLRTKKFFRYYIEQKIEKPLAALVGGNNVSETGIIVEWLRWHEGSLRANVCEKKIGRDEFGGIRTQGPVDGGLKETLLLKGCKGRFITCRLFVACIFQKPSFTSYISPYLFSFFAIILGACNTL